MKVGHFLPILLSQIRQRIFYSHESNPLGTKNKHNCKLAKILISIVAVDNLDNIISPIELPMHFSISSIIDLSSCSKCLKDLTIQQSKLT